MVGPNPIDRHRPGEITFDVGICESSEHLPPLCSRNRRSSPTSLTSLGLSPGLLCKMAMTFEDVEPRSYSFYVNGSVQIVSLLYAEIIKLKVKDSIRNVCFKSLLHHSVVDVCLVYRANWRVGDLY